MTEWKKISDCPDYEVSSNGEIRNSITGSALKPRNVNGYSHVTLCDVNGHHQKAIHRIVAKEFIENPNNYPVINHIDGVKTNNRVDNLEWCSQSYNMKHAYQTGLQKPIKKQINAARLKSNEVRRRPVRNIDTGEQYDSIVDCAKKENICHSAVSYHLAGKARRCRFEYVDKGGEYHAEQS